MLCFTWTECDMLVSSARGRTVARKPALEVAYMSLYEIPSRAMTSYVSGSGVVAHPRLRTSNESSHYH